MGSGISQPNPVPSSAVYSRHEGQRRPPRKTPVAGTSSKTSTRYGTSPSPPSSSSPSPDYSPPSQPSDRGYSPTPPPSTTTSLPHAAGHPRANSHLGLAPTLKAEQQALTTPSVSQAHHRPITGVVFRSNADGKLALTDQGFCEFPVIVLTFIHLVELDLSDNAIPEIPEGITHLTNLTSLSLTGNEIRELPANLSGLSNLKHLHLAFNLIESINPDSLQGIPNLEELHFEFNRLTSLPSLACLSKLIGLCLEGNDFSAPNSIPAMLYTAKSQQEIHANLLI